MVDYEHSCLDKKGLIRCYASELGEHHGTQLTPGQVMALQEPAGQEIEMTQLRFLLSWWPAGVDNMFTCGRDGTIAGLT